MKKNNPLFLRFECQILGFLVSFFFLDLASTEASSGTIALKVIDSTFLVDTVRGKPRMWFASVVVASPFRIGFTPT